MSRLFGSMVRKTAVLLSAAVMVSADGGGTAAPPIK
eukprot:COSAG02_NODE_58533_length_277_cov_0.578652_1_plen_35_part_10